MTKVKTAQELFYFVEDIMLLLGISRSHAYKIMKELNDELFSSGYHFVRGRVRRSYFDERFGLNAACPSSKGSSFPG